MNLNRILSVAVAATTLAIAGPAAAHGAGDTVVPKFASAIPNIPGKSLIAVEVLYPKLLAVFVVDSDDKELTINDK